MKALLPVLLILLGCASSTPRAPEGGSIADAVRFAREGKNEETRHALGIGCLAKLPAACHALGRNLPPPQKRLGILQGPTNSTSSTVAVLYAKPSQVTVLLWDPTDTRLVLPTKEKDFAHEGSPWTVRQARFDGLVSDRPYMLQVLDGENLLDSRELWALDTSKGALRFAVASCMDDKYADIEKDMWEGLLSEKPELVLFIGDNVYADRVGDGVKAADANQFWQRYSETRSLLTVFQQNRLVPVFATWDDHDYGVNDGDRSFPGQGAARETFLAFFPQSMADGITKSGPGVASTFALRGQRFILMDDRSFRSAPKEGKTETHFGLEQENWLFASLVERSYPTWIVSGDQFYGGYSKYESYEGNHPTSFAQWKRRMKKVKAPFVLVSGDRHHTELSEIAASELGKKTYEITSSAIHAKTYPNTWQKEKNPRQIAGVPGVTNFVVVDSTATKREIKFKVTAFGPGKKVLYEKDLFVRGN